jgi:Secretion system C-terminal sorting domain
MRMLLTLCSVFTLTVTQLSAQTVQVVSGEITQNTTWTADKIYVLTGYVYVKNNATLTIQPGTLIQGDKQTHAALVIRRGGKIIADGTRQMPIVFTSNASQPAPGDWGGLVLCGYAPTNTNTGTGIACLGVAEGGIDTPDGDARYGSGDQPGGCGNADDNSGILRFVRIEYAGYAFQLNNELNGLTLAGVGRGTTIDYVQVSHSGDDGFEFFGGTVNCKHLISYGNRDDDFDMDLGYQGNIQFALAIRNPLLADVSGSNGLEVDNDGSGTTATPKTRPNLSNFTIIGPSGTVADNYRRNAHIRRNAEPALFNSLLMGEYPVGIFVDGLATITNAQNNLIEIKNTRVADAPELLKTSDNSFNISQWFGNTAWNNTAANSSMPFGLPDPFNYANPNAQPPTNAAVATGASFQSPRTSINFFQQVSYLGALDPTEDWTCQWAKFATLNNDCLVETSDATQAIQSVQVLPNPAQDRIQVSFNLPRPAQVALSIFGLDGRLMAQPVLPQPAAQGLWKGQIEVANLNTGLYFLQISADHAIRTEKILIVR